MTQNNEETHEEKKVPKNRKRIVLYGVIGSLLLCGSALGVSIATNQPSTPEVKQSKKAPTELKSKKTYEERDLNESLTVPEKKKEKSTESKTSTGNSVFDLFGLEMQKLPETARSSRVPVLLALAEETNQVSRTDQNKKPIINIPAVPEVEKPGGDILPPEIPEKPVEPPITPEIPITPPNLESTPVIHMPVSTIMVEKHTSFDIQNYYQVTDSLDNNPIIHYDGAIDMAVSGFQTVVVRVSNKFGREASAVLSVFVNARPKLLPIKSGAVEIQIDSTNFNFLSTVYAYDDEDGNISDSIEIISNTVDVTKEGTGVVTFKVTDSSGYSDKQTVVFNVTNEAPVISFVDETDHEINQEFDPLSGVEINDREDGVIQVTEDMILENTVDITTVGTYFVTYEVKDNHGKSSGVQRREVVVTNQAPVFHNVVDKEYHVKTLVTKEMLLEGITVSDREDDRLNLPLSINLNEEQFQLLDGTQEGNFIVALEATDSMGATTTKEMTIRFINDAPTIVGVQPTIELEVGADFNPYEGVVASDTESDTLQIHIDGLNAEGKLDTSLPGVYVLAYWTEDEHGKRCEVTSVITINEKLPEVPDVPVELPSVPKEEVEGTPVILPETELKLVVPIIETELSEQNPVTTIE